MLFAALIEGDILATQAVEDLIKDSQLRDPNEKRKVLKKHPLKFWPSARVPYVVDSTLSKFASFHFENIDCGIIPCRPCSLLSSCESRKFLSTKGLCFSGFLFVEHFYYISRWCNIKQDKRLEFKIK